MIWDAVIEKIIREGYEDISENVEAGSILIKRLEDNSMDICIVIKNVEHVYFKAEQIVELNHNLDSRFLLLGYKDVHIMNIIYTDKELDVCELTQIHGDFWIVDMQNFALQIYENQPDDYKDLKLIIESGLDEKGKIAIEESKIENRLKKFPWVTSVLLLANVVYFVVCSFLGDLNDTNFMVEMGAMNNEIAVYFNEYYRIYTSMFLHFGWEHLINNMFSLIILGIILERWLGHTRFTTVYYLSGIGAAATSMVYHMLTEQIVVSAGASGAIFGLYGAWIISILRNESNKKQYSSIGLALLIMIVSGFGGGIDLAAHIGGLITGAIITYIVTLDKVKKRRTY